MEFDIVASSKTPKLAGLIAEQIPVEMWKSLAFMGLSKYEASTEGRLRNVENNHIFIGSLEGKYRRTNLINDLKEQVHYQVHILIAMAWIPNDDPLTKTTVDHIYGDTQDNRVKNLRWASPSEQGRNRKMPTNIRGKAVYRINPSDNTMVKYISVTMASTAIKGDRHSIASACKNGSLYKGYNWTYCSYIDTIEGEVWKLIPYLEFVPTEVSSHGRIRDPVTKLLRNPFKTPNGYVCIHLNSVLPGGGRTQIFIYRLVISAFKGRQDDLEVNHINTIHDDDRLDNLEYRTHQQNMDHAVANGKMERPNNHMHNQSKCKVVVQMDPKTNIEVATFPSIKEAAQKMGVSHNAISNAIYGPSSTCQGFIWQFAK